MAQKQLGVQSMRLYAETPRARRMAAVITSEQVRAARALLRWEQKDLAAQSGLAVVTIQTIERRPGPIMVQTRTLYALLRAFDRAGVEFLDPGDGGAGVRFKGGRR